MPAPTNLIEELDQGCPNLVLSLLKERVPDDIPLEMGDFVKANFSGHADLPSPVFGAKVVLAPDTFQWDSEVFTYEHDGGAVANDVTGWLLWLNLLTGPRWVAYDNFPSSRALVVEGDKLPRFGIRLLITRLTAFGLDPTDWDLVRTKTAYVQPKQKKVRGYNLVRGKERQRVRSLERALAIIAARDGRVCLENPPEDFRGQFIGHDPDDPATAASFGVLQKRCQYLLGLIH